MYESIDVAEKYVVPFDRQSVKNVAQKDIEGRLCESIANLIHAGNHVANADWKVLSSLEIDSYSAEIAAKIKSTTEEYMNALVNVRRGAKQIFVRLQNVSNASASDAQFEKLFALSSQIDDCNRLSNLQTPIKDLFDCPKQPVVDYFDKLAALQELASNVVASWQIEQDCLDVNVDELKREYEEIAKKSFLVRFKEKSKFLEQINTRFAFDLTFEKIPELFESIASYQSAKQALTNAQNELTQIQRNAVDYFDNKEDYLDAYKEYEEATQNASLSEAGKEFIQRYRHDATFRALCQEFEQSYVKFARLSKQFNETLKRVRGGKQNTLDSEILFCENLQNSYSALRDWAAFVVERKRCISLGLKPVVERYEQTRGADDFAAYALIAGFRKGIYRALVHAAIEDSNVLFNFRSDSIARLCTQYSFKTRNLESESTKEILRLAALRIRELKNSTDPEIQKELLKLKVVDLERETLREFIASVQHIFTRLCPCVFSTPEDVAQHLPQIADEFDLVVIGDGSQIRTAQAAGSIVRAKHIVIVDNSRRTPAPINERPLDVVLNSTSWLLPTLKFTRCYRALHESLLFYASEIEYERKLSIVPSVHPDLDLAIVPSLRPYRKSIQIHEDNDSLYSEELELITETLDLYRNDDSHKHTLQIVVLSQIMFDELSCVFELMKMDDASFDEWAHDCLTISYGSAVEHSSSETVFLAVGNPDDDDMCNLYSPFFPNAVASRATLWLDVFSNESRKTDEEETLDRDPLFPIDHFIEFTNNDLFPPANGNREFHTDGIVNAICEEIRRCGLSYRLDVGLNESWVDIAVLSPVAIENENEDDYLHAYDDYILGIQLDGPRYAAIKDVYEREIKQTALLEERGWKIYRVWSIDFFLNREETLAKLREEILAQKRESWFKRPPVSLNDLSKQSAQFSKNFDWATETFDKLRQLQAQFFEEELTSQPKAQSVLLPPPAPNAASFSKEDYVEAPPAERQLTSEEYVLPETQSILVERVQTILEYEAPIHRDVLIQKVCSSLGVNKSKKVVEATENALKKVKFTSRKPFCWAPDQEPDAYAEFRVSTDRKPDEICRQEIQNAVCYVLSTQGALKRDDLIAETAHAFGKRVTDAFKEAISDAIDKARNKTIVQTGRKENALFSLLGADE